jgi:TolB-like protein/DNA-binding winged helix-turn-helix (wHTH) protein/Flp pilus assembly protein TadD
MQSEGIFQFGKFRVDAPARTLRWEEQIIPLNRRAFDVLLNFVRNPGRVLTRDELIKNVWSEAFVDENSLAQSISTLRRALAEKPGDKRYIITLAGRGYQFVVPVTLVGPGNGNAAADAAAASVGSSQPSSTQQDAPSTVGTADQKDGVNSPIFRKRGLLPLSAALVTGLILVLSYASWSIFRPAPHAKPRKVMLAVLPFMNFTGDASQDYVCDGLTEEMIAQLGQINQEGLGIIARTSAMSYKGTSKSVGQIGRELSVDYVLEGSVRRWGDRARISAQLIKTSDQTNIWSENYESDSRDILKLQSEFAEGIAKHIDLVLTPEETARVRSTVQVDPRVYELYLLGRYEWNKRTEAGLNQAIAHFQQAIDSDAKYAPAYAGMAQALALLPYYSDASANEATAKAKFYAEQALRLDANTVEAHATLGFVSASSFNWPVAGVEYRRALQLNPNYATARQWYSFYLWITKGHNEALEELDRARQLDPLSLIINTDEARLLCASQQTDRAIGLLQKAITLDPKFADAHRSLALAYIQKGRIAEAISEAHLGADLDPNDYEEATLGYVYAVAGKPKRARDILAKLSTNTRNPAASPVYLSFIHVGLGEKDQAFANLEKAYWERSGLLELLQFETIFDPLRADPRFADICHRLGEANIESSASTKLNLGDPLLPRQLAGPGYFP